MPKASSGFGGGWAGRSSLANDGISHVSLFALAPQPLLILLGSMLTDLVLTDVFAHHKEPEGWTWADEGEDLGFRVTPPPPDAKGDPCLVLSVSGTVSDDRISHAAIGRDIAIWRLDVMEAHNDCLKTREQLSGFRAAVGPPLAQIKARRGQPRHPHIFPALPAAMAVELGRVRSPKADQPWEIYDQNNAMGGFVRALAVPQKEIV